MSACVRVYVCLIPIQLFMGWVGVIVVVVRRVGCFKLRCGFEWVFRNTFDADNIVNDLLRFLEVVAYPVFVRNALLLKCECKFGYAIAKVCEFLFLFLLHDDDDDDDDDVMLII